MLYQGSVLCPLLLTISNRRLPLDTTHSINNCAINKFTHNKYLEVTISQNQSWSTHIDNIPSKANSVDATLQRNLRKQCSYEVKSLPYFCYVREYPSVVWSPNTKANKLKYLSVKPLDLFTILDNYSSVTNMLHQRFPQAKRWNKATFIKTHGSVLCGPRSPGRTQTWVKLLTGTPK